MTVRVRWATLAFAFSFFFTLASRASADEYWVDGASGADGNAGTADAPFATVARGLQEAQPGDTVIVRAGVYAEAIGTVTAGEMGAPITVRAERSRAATLQASGTVIGVAHPYHVFEGLVIDGMLGPGRAVELETAATATVLRDLEIKNSGRNCVDMDSPQGVLIEKSIIHHCLLWDTTTNAPADAHGVTGTGPIDLTIRDTEIRHFSGDAIQLSPPREFWDNLVVENTVMWTGPLPEAAGMFAAGTIVGENAFDSKTPDSGPRCRATFRNVVAYGFKGFITNQAAFNAKENVELVVDRVSVYESELAFRTRGPALVTLRNALTFANDHAVRYEDGIVDLHLANVTLGEAAPLFDGGGGGLGAGFLLQNGLFLAASLPPEVDGVASNMLATAEMFVDAAANDYHLVEGSAPMDAGETLADVTTDRDGVPRPFGPSYDIGAYEWTNMPPPDGGVPATGSGSGASGPGASGATSGAGAASSGDDPGEDSGCSCLVAGGRRWTGSAFGIVVAVAAAAIRRRRRPSF